MVSLKKVQIITMDFLKKLFKKSTLPSVVSIKAVATVDPLQNQCVLCYDDFGYQQTTQCQVPVLYTTKLCTCKVIVGKGCLEEWFETNNYCIVCRKVLREGHKNAGAGAGAGGRDGAGDGGGGGGGANDIVDTGAGQDGAVGGTSAANNENQVVGFITVFFPFPVPYY